MGSSTSNKLHQGGFGRLGVVLATAGSAVGLGNIWKFPYILGDNGGAAFLIIYIGCVLLFGIPLMITEMYIGKASHKTMNDAFLMLSGSNRWQWIAWITVLCSFLLLSFYLVVTGWCFEYTYLSLIDHFSGTSPAGIEQHFKEFSESKTWPIIWTIVALFCATAIEWAGVEKGIERASKFLMPLLLVILFILIGKGLMMDGSTAGVRFLLSPDWSKFSVANILAALGQCFFSLSVGMGCLIAYSAYMQPSQDLPKTAMQVATIDTLVAVLAGIAIFPAVFALGIDPTEGPELVFVTLPSVFEQMNGGVIFSTLFFLLMTIAALTSVVSLMEVGVSFLKGITGGWSRQKRMIIVVPLLAIASVSCVLVPNLFDWFDIFTSRFLIPLIAMTSAIFFGWVCKKKDIFHEMETHSTLPKWAVKLFFYLIRYVTPLLILAVFISSFH